MVPTGNFGDIFAGEAAMRMGLAVERLVIATNANDIMARALNDGVYAAGAAHTRSSPSMDIQVASNFERALFEASGRDADWTARRDGTISPATGRLELPPRVLAALRARYSAFASDDAETLATINARRRADRPDHRSAHRGGRRGVAQAGLARGAGGGALHRPSRQIPRRGDPGHRHRRRSCRPAGTALANLPEKLEILPNKLSLIRQFISSRLAA